MLNGSLQIKNGIYQAVFYIPGSKSATWRSTGIKAQRGNKRKAEQKMTEILSEFEEKHFIRVIPHILWKKYLPKITCLTFAGTT